MWIKISTKVVFLHPANPCGRSPSCFVCCWTWGIFVLPLCWSFTLCSYYYHCNKSQGGWLFLFLCHPLDVIKQHPKLPLSPYNVQFNSPVPRKNPQMSESWVRKPFTNSHRVDQVSTWGFSKGGLSHDINPIIPPTEQFLQLSMLALSQISLFLGILLPCLHLGSLAQSHFPVLFFSQHSSPNDWNCSQLLTWICTFNSTKVRSGEK